MGGGGWATSRTYSRHVVHARTNAICRLHQPHTSLSGDRELKGEAKSRRYLSTKETAYASEGITHLVRGEHDLIPYAAQDRPDTAVINQEAQLMRDHPPGYLCTAYQEGWELAGTNTSGSRHKFNEACFEIKFKEWSDIRRNFLGSTRNLDALSKGRPWGLYTVKRSKRVSWLPKAACLGWSKMNEGRWPKCPALR